MNLCTRAGRLRVREGHRKGHDVPASLRSLAALTSAGLTPRAALTTWTQHAPDGLEPITRAVGRRAALGAPLVLSLRPLEEVMATDDLCFTEASFELHARFGGDLAHLLRIGADRIERRMSADQEGRIAAAGASLSGRLVAALPLVFTPLAPMARAPLFDALGLFFLVVGIGLAVAGMRWIARLVPHPTKQENPLSLVAETAAAFLKGGAPLPAALTAAALAAPKELGGELARCLRLTRLGRTWVSVLGTSRNEGLRSMSGILRRSAELGLCTSTQLESFSEAQRELARRALDHDLRRAPVLMVVPLAACVLPAFVLLAIVPFLRGLSLQG